MERAKVSSKGQIVIPKYLRDALGMSVGKNVLIIKEGDKLILIAEPDDPVKGLEKAGEELSLRNIRREIKEE